MRKMTMLYQVKNYFHSYVDHINSYLACTIIPEYMKPNLFRRFEKEW